MIHFVGKTSTADSYSRDIYSDRGASTRSTYLDRDRATSLSITTQLQTTDRSSVTHNPDVRSPIKTSPESRASYLRSGGDSFRSQPSGASSRPVAHSHDSPPTATSAALKSRYSSLEQPKYVKRFLFDDVLQ
jgi:hypothetical protein